MNETNSNYLSVDTTDFPPIFQQWGFTGHKGWECPKCGHCWSPSVQGCQRCNAGVTIAPNPNITPYPVDTGYPPLPCPPIICTAGDQT